MSALVVATVVVSSDPNALPAGHIKAFHVAPRMSNLHPLVGGAGQAQSLVVPGAFHHLNFRTPSIRLITQSCLPAVYPFWAPVWTGPFEWTTLIGRSRMLFPDCFEWGRGGGLRHFQLFLPGLVGCHWGWSLVRRDPLEIVPLFEVTGRGQRDFAHRPRQDGTPVR